MPSTASKKYNLPAKIAYEYSGWCLQESIWFAVYCLHSTVLHHGCTNSKAKLILVLQLETFLHWITVAAHGFLYDWMDDATNYLWWPFCHILLSNTSRYTSIIYYSVSVFVYKCLYIVEIIFPHITIEDYKFKLNIFSYCIYSTTVALLNMVPKKSY